MLIKVFKSTGVEELMFLVSQLKTKLHPQHHLVTDLQLDVARRLGRDGGEGDLRSASDQILKSKVDLVKELLQVMAILHPGRTKWRGLLLYELGDALTTLAGRQSCRQTSQTMLRSAKEAFEDGIRSLQFDRVETYEGGVCMKMKNLLTEISTEDVKTI